MVLRYARHMIALLLLTACGGRSKGEEVSAYSATVASAGQDPASDMRRCLALSDADLRGDCAAVVAQRAIAAGRDPAAWCAQVPEGRWRSECQFQASEAAAQTQGAGAAAGLCQQAGAFQADCLMHLWQLPLSRLVAGMGSDGFGARYAQADALFQEARAVEGMPIDLEQRFWLSYFQSGFSSTGKVDLGACAGLPTQGGQRCEGAGALLLTEGLEGALRGAGRLESFCAGEAPGSAALAELLGVQPSAALDRAVADQQDAICGRGRRPMIRGGRPTR